MSEVRGLEHQRSCCASLFANVGDSDAGPCGFGGVEMDDCYEHAQPPDGGPCDVECRNGKLCLVRPGACRTAPIIIGPTEYLAPR